MFIHTQMLNDLYQKSIVLESIRFNYDHYRSYILIFTWRNALFDAETAWVLPTKLGTAKVDGFDWKTGFAWIIGANVLGVTPSWFNDGVTTVTEGVKDVFGCWVGEWLLDGTAWFDKVVEIGNNDAKTLAK